MFLKRVVLASPINFFLGMSAGIGFGTGLIITKKVDRMLFKKNLYKNYNPEHGPSQK